MKRRIISAFWGLTALLAAGSSWAQSSDGVTIGGVTWARTNVGDAGEFVPNPEDYGGYFTFAEAQEACPDGWRTPTKEELESLTEADGKWMSVNSVDGNKYGGEDNWIFLPAAGYRSAVNNTLYHQSFVGYYWSSLPDGNRAYSLSFREDVVVGYVGTGSRGRDLSLRCVRL